MDAWAEMADQQLVVLSEQRTNLDETIQDLQDLRNQYQETLQKSGKK